ncbi:hypothetical protein SAMN05216548_106156 [Faunimonas pinastri]|uniref:DUF2125 domain-containing protein n=1 Tax=Faunimonas pinastri TaxID=1855383 RepID=A0A1H9HTE6_9HYPH|nr:DUF2125 domain-containing protein [Faunimonas pinastri]SEQ65593.1 hypothetical protein SAMN05216548_106156 [Faunimonas pinastri]
MRRVPIIILIVVLVLAAGWYVAWRVLARQVDVAVSDALHVASEHGSPITCTDRRTSGFPLKVRISCSETTVSDQKSGVQARLAGVTAETAIYTPNRVTTALASPATITVPNLSEPIRGEWQTGTLTLDRRDAEISSSRLDLDTAKVTISGSEIVAKTLSALVAPARDEQRTSVGFSFADASLHSGDLSTPAMNGTGSAILSVPPQRVFTGLGDLRSTGLQVSAIQIAASSGDLKANISGDVQADPDGQLNGSLNVDLLSIDALPGFMKTLPPAARQLGNTMAGAILMFAQPVEVNGAQARRLHFDIHRGKVALGPIKLGRVAPLW